MNIKTEKRFISNFGIVSTLCVLLFEYLSAISDKFQPKHMLWTLNFMKEYSTELQFAAKWKVDEKTFRKWVSLTIDVLFAIFTDSALSEVTP